MAETDLIFAGFEQAISNLNNLPDKVAKPALAKALRRGAAVFRKSARRHAPVRSVYSTPVVRRVGPVDPRQRAPGYLKRNITVTRAKRGRLFFRIGPRQNAFYGHIVEVGHDNADAQPWLEPSFRVAQGAAEGAIRRRLEQEIAKAVRTQIRG